MKLFGFYISRVPKPTVLIWNRGVAKRVSDLTPAEMQEELLWAARVLKEGRYIYVPQQNRKQVIHTADVKPYQSPRSY